MSGQSDDEQLHQQFGMLLHGFDMIEAGEVQIRFKFPDRLLKAYEANGRPGWLGIYEMEPGELFVQSVQDVFRLLGISQDDRLKGIPIGEQPAFQQFIKLHEQIEERDTLLELFSDKLLPLALTGRCLVAMVVAQFQYRMSIQDIIRFARGNDGQSVLRLVKLDPAFLYTDYVTRHIHRAVLSKNDGFFEDLSKSLQPDDKFWSLKGQRRYVALFLLHHIPEYTQRTDREWAEFLAKEEYNFPDYADPENVRRARGRYSLKKPKHAG